MIRNTNLVVTWNDRGDPDAVDWVSALRKGGVDAESVEESSDECPHPTVRRISTISRGNLTICSVCNEEL